MTFIKYDKVFLQEAGHDTDSDIMFHFVATALYKTQLSVWESLRKDIPFMKCILLCKKALN